MKSKNNRLVTIVAAIVVLGIAAAGIAYAALVFTSGSGEASQDVNDAVASIDAGENTIYQIDPEQSEARFYINEVLNGADVRVEGITNQVGGQITVDMSNPSNSQIGEILVNARTLETDRSMRNRALRSFILLSGQDQYEFITFQPTELTGLPTEPVSVGETIEFQIVGDLTITDVTQSVTFDASVTVNNDDTISGSASTTVLYPDFELTIPDVSQVASVEDEVLLEIDFVATPLSDNAATE